MVGSWQYSYIGSAFILHNTIIVHSLLFYFADFYIKIRKTLKVKESSKDDKNGPSIIRKKLSLNEVRYNVILLPK